MGVQVLSSLENIDTIAHVTRDSVIRINVTFTLDGAANAQEQ